MAVVKIVPFPGAPGQRGPKGDQGDPGISSVSSPLVYNTETQSLSVDQDGFTHIGQLDYLDYDTNVIVEPNSTAGRMMWDQYHETVRLGVGHGATLDLGQEFQIPVFNVSGDDIAKGTLVMAELDNNGRIRTIEDGKFRVTKAITNGVFDASVILGVTLTPIPNGSGGLITTHGHVHDVDTAPWVLGDILWADPAVPGGLTTTAPAAPNLKLPIATVTYTNGVGEGTLFVKMVQGSSLGETDHNVQITNPQDGDILKYNASLKIWYNAQP